MIAFNPFSELRWYHMPLLLIGASLEFITEKYREWGYKD